MMFSDRIINIALMEYLKETNASNQDLLVELKSEIRYLKEQNISLKEENAREREEFKAEIQSKDATHTDAINQIRAEINQINESLSNQE